jgi:hypothetical protein
MNFTRPLGLISSKKDSSIVDRVAIIDKLDLSYEKRTLLKLNPEFTDLIDLLERELKRFLSLRVIYPEETSPFGPPRQVDELWHIFILNTPKYRRFCDEAYGEYLDHEPEESASKRRGLYAGEINSITKQRYSQAFGALPPAIWGPTMTCTDIGKCIG